MWNVNTPLISDVLNSTRHHSKVMSGILTRRQHQIQFPLKWE
jgi:hypothetical protein